MKMMSKLFFHFRLRLLCLFPIPILLSSLLFLECSPRAASPDNKEIVNTTTAGSAPVTTAVTPKKLERYHYWGNYRLERNGDSYQLDTLIKECRYEFKEIKTGVVSVHRSPIREEDYDLFPDNFTALEFYDTITHQLKKVVDLNKANPFIRQNYKNLQVGGGLDYEFMEFYGPDANCKWPELPNPDRYITNSEVYCDNYSDYIFVSFTLIHMAGNSVVGWEYIVTIFNEYGKQVANHKVDKDVLASAITQHGKYFCYATKTTEYLNSQPWDDCTNRFVVFDLVSQKIVFTFEEKSKVEISPYMKQKGDNFLYILTKQDIVFLFFIDEANQIIREYEMTKENWEKIRIKKSINEMLKNEKTSKKYNM